MIQLVADYNFVFYLILLLNGILAFDGWRKFGPELWSLGLFADPIDYASMSGITSTALSTREKYWYTGFVLFETLGTPLIISITTAILAYSLGKAPVYGIDWKSPHLTWAL